MKANNLVQLKTSDSPLDEMPLKEYPRPQLVRDSYICLNGEWELATSSDDKIPSTFDKKIIVPYCVESYLSKINYCYPLTTNYFYRKEFNLDPSFIKDKVILHFDSVDQECAVYINGSKVKENKGGYIPFEVEIQDHLHSEKNEIIVVVKDSLNHDYPWGKQRVDRQGMWYTPVSGIWKSVWLESVSNDYIKDIKISTSLNEVTLNINSDAEYKIITIHTPNKDIIRRTKEKQITIKIPNPILWDINNPHLYYFDIETDNDKVTSYFGLRTFEIKQKGEHPYFFLNNKPLFIHGLLDQGYYPDGIYTPHSYKEYERDILRMKELGFNTLRKHIKIEPLYFYYLCDKYGMLVAQDFVNNGNYSFIRDTALPTIRINVPEWLLLNKNKKGDMIFYEQMKKTVDLLYNSPSLFMWTIYNEGWGQKNPDKAYLKLKELDSTRLIDSTSGWFERKNTDFNSLHIYFRRIKLKPNKKPIFISEFGGFGYKLKDHSFNPDNTYGYGLFTKQEYYQNAIDDLYLNQVVPNIKNGLMGTIYTQVSDVEDETNGLLTYDRKICKVDKEKMLKIAEQLVIK